MEYRQLRPFREFFTEGIKQKGKLLSLAVELAQQYLGEPTGPKKDECLTSLDNTTNGDCNKECKESTGDSEVTDSKENQTATAADKKMAGCSKNNKILGENLNKRKPVVKSAEMNIQKLKKIQAQKVENKAKKVLVEPIKEKRKLSSSSMPISKQFVQHTAEPIPASKIVLETVELKDVVGVADKLAESLTLIRDNPERFSRDQREGIYAKINEFCYHCRNMSDSDLKELVKQRLGSYLTATVHLLNEVNEQKSAFFSIAVENLSLMLAFLKEKIFMNVKPFYR